MPPRIPLWFLKRMTAFHQRHSMVEDFEETFEEIKQTSGIQKARHWYWLNVFKSLPEYIKFLIHWRTMMVFSYLKTTLRNIRNNKIYSLINIIGLALGLACFILIILWVAHEMSYDRFHTDSDKIYRITCHSVFQGEHIDAIGTPAPLAPAIIKELPEVAYAARIRWFPRIIFKYGSNAFYEDKVLGIDPSFFEIFNFTFISGNPKTALSDLFNIILTKETAQKYFGSENPLNKSINVEGRANFVVTGVVDTIPNNSSLEFDFLVSYKCVEAFEICGLGWGDPNFWTYVKCKHTGNAKETGEKITEVAKIYGCPLVVRYNAEFRLQPLKQVHLNPVGSYDYVKGNINYVYIFSIIGFFILTIACINFVNLSTARFGKRAKEVGLRKVIGAHRGQIARELLGESFFLVCISMVSAVIAVKFMMPVFNSLTGKNLILNVWDIKFLFLFLVILCLTTLVAGLYPAMYLSSFSPSAVLKGNGSRPSLLKISGNLLKEKSFRNLLVVTQFSISIILIICTTVVYDQLHYILINSWKPEGRCIIHIPVKENIATKYDYVKERLLSQPDILSVSLKDCLPTTLINWTGEVSWENRAVSDERIVMETTRIEYDYFKTLGIDIVAGRDFSRKFADDQQAYILNEEAVKQMGMENPIGKTFALYGKKGPIIGIVRNTHFQSFRLKYPPQVFHLFTNINDQAFEGAVLINVRIPDSSSRSKILSTALSRIEDIWKEVNTLAPFEYQFLDDTIESQYRKEQHLSSLFGIFSFLAIIISCLGLFGLASYSSECRTKEIGIRKVLGASTLKIQFLFIKEFIKWVVLANIIAWPVADYAMGKWLQGFTYRTSIGFLPFLAAGTTALIIALVTVYHRTYKAATANPVDSLK